MTWNDERFVEAALSAALAQDYSPLEIVISDDASTDGTWTIVERLVAAYVGPHRLRLNRNARNLGVGAHNDLIMTLAQGDMVVLSAGDDIDELDRVSAIVQTWQTDPTGILCLASYATGIDEDGQSSKVIAPFISQSSIDAIGLARTGAGLLGATLAVHKRLFETFGPIGSEIRTCEDVVLPFRATLLGRIAIIDRPLVRYRSHAGSLMGAVAPIATDSQAFIAGSRRMLEGSLAARRRQLADLAQTSQIPPDAKTQALREALNQHLVKNEAFVGLIHGRRGSLIQLLTLTAAGKLSFAEAIKTILMARMPASWFHYISWRHKRGRSQRTTRQTTNAAR